MPGAAAAAGYRLAVPTPPSSDEPRRIRIGRELEGERLDRALARTLDVSRGDARRLLSDGAVRIAREPVAEGDEGPAASEADAFRTLALRDKGSVLEIGQLVLVDAFTPPAERRALVAPELALDVLGEGDGWIAVDKPAGVPVHPLRADERATALGFVASRHPEVHGVGEAGLRSGVVHRLDVDTSGALLLATSQRRWETLRSGFARHAVEKRYRAIVAGEFRQTGTQRFALHIAAHRPARVRVARLGPGDAAPSPVRDDARTVEQWVDVVETFPASDATLLDVRPRTGFLHQIRATLAELGHPVLGDATYGESTVAARAPRQMLHAAYVRFDDEAFGDTVEAISPDPPDFARVLAGLR